MSEELATGRLPLRYLGTSENIKKKKKTRQRETIYIYIHTEREREREMTKGTECWG